MKWRILVELAGADGSVQSHEISVGGWGAIDSSAETLGLTLAEGKKTLAGAATPFGSGADGGALPEPATLPALRGATAAEGHSSPAAGVVVWRGGGSCTPLRSLPVRCGVAPDHHPCRGDHARPMHAGV